MDSLDRAEKHLKIKYQKAKKIFDVMDMGYVVEIYEVNEKELKLLFLNHKVKKTIIYHLTIEGMIE